MEAELEKEWDDAELLAGEGQALEAEGEQLLTLKQVATILQVECSTVRHWEKEFAEYMGKAVLINQKKHYTTRQLEVLTKIKELLQTEQYTIKGAKRRLELDNVLAASLGVEHNFKTTVFIMFSAIMQELQAARQESRELAREVARLREEKNRVEEQLAAAENRGLLDYLWRRWPKARTAEEQGRA